MPINLSVNGGAIVRSSMVVAGEGIGGTSPIFQVATSTMVVLANGNVSASEQQVPARRSSADGYNIKHIQ